MATTPRLKLPYPEEFTDPWFETFTAFVEAVDVALYAAREDRNTLIFGGGVVTFNASTGVLAWTSDIFFLSPVTGYRWKLATGSVTVADGQLAFATVSRAPQSENVVTLTV